MHHTVKCHSVSSLQNYIVLLMLFVYVCVYVCVCLCGDYCSSTVGDHVMWSGVYSCCSSSKSCEMVCSQWVHFVCCCWFML